MKTNDLHRGRPGRPPAGAGVNGTPEYTSRYPKVTFYLPPLEKARLEAVSIILDKPAWKILENAFRQYLRSLPEEDQSVIEALIQRRAEAQIVEDSQSVEDAPDLEPDLAVAAASVGA